MPHHCLANKRSWIDDELPYERDLVCQAFVRCNPNGATLEEISKLLKVTRERVRQIEFRALRKVRNRCRELGIRLQTLLPVSEPQVDWFAEAEVPWESDGYEEAASF